MSSPEQTLLSNQISQKIENTSENKTKKRRTRKELKDRDYRCGCGKAYLSYPALYTHLKQKHDGKTPAGTNMPPSGKTGVRGRPPIKKEESGHNSKDEDFEGSLGSTEDFDSMQDLLYFLNKIVKPPVEEESKSPNETEKLVIPKESENSNKMELFPSDIFPSDSQQIQRELKLLFETNGEIVEETDETTQLKKTLCDKIFAIFLYKISKNVSDECFKDVAIFVILFRRNLNERGWTIYNEQKKNSDINKNVSEDYCTVNNGEFALEIANEFVVDNFQKFWNEIKENISSKILGDEEEKLKNLVFLTQHFCNWLFNNYYTNSRLSLNLTENN